VQSAKNQKLRNRRAVDGRSRGDSFFPPAAAGATKYCGEFSFFLLLFPKKNIQWCVGDGEVREDVNPQI